VIDILSTIIPIFAIIFLGWFVRRRGFVQPQLLGPANRLVYYVAVPALIFREIAEASFRTQFDATILACTLLPVVVVFGLSLAAGSLAGIPRIQLGTFMQSAFHGNLGYIGLAVAYYFLGTEGFVRAGIIAAFLMLLQNSLAPLALLVKGASLSFKLLRLHLLSALGAGIFKLFMLPALGYFLYRWFELQPQDYLPGLILLAAPTATLTYVMATEMNGDPDLAIAAISVNTMLSAIAFAAWLGIAG